MDGTTGQQKLLDLRYNEMWNDWDGTDELRKPTERVHGGLVLSWKRLNVSVKLTTQKFFGRSKTAYKQILHNISGNVQCGSLLGIMGSSGSGKTTLMATISHRTKGNFEGELLFNGQSLSEEVMIKISGFVPQHDISFEQLTALEHLSLMVNLKMDRHTTESAKKERIDRIATALGMNAFLDTEISFLSGGERKITALAVQLLNDPPLLFCDEITTGLDSYSAAHIINTLRDVARTGKIVVCTIHQPASGVYGKFDQVLLLTEGRLAYQGPVTMVKELFRKFHYESPDMFNEADFVISILSSDSEEVKRDIDEMCKLSSTDKQIDLNYELFNNKKQLDLTQYLRTQKPHWTTQFRLISDRSFKCFIRSYRTKLMELATILFLGVIISVPYANLQFDTNAVQNWEGFWLFFVLNCVFHFFYSTIMIYEEKFSIVHQEVHNKVYPLSAYVVSEFVIMVVWIAIKTSLYWMTAFWIVGLKWSIWQSFVFFMIAFSSFSYGCVLSAYFSRVEHSAVFATIYEFIALPLSGAYLSFRSLPKLILSLRYFSLFFLGCETVSVLFWENIHYLPCIDVDHCLRNGEAVLSNHGFISNEFYFDVVLLILFSLLANVFSYIGIHRRMKKQPAY